MISFTSKPGLTISGLSLPQWDASRFTSWINTVLVPWVNNRSGLVLITSTEITSTVDSVEFTEGISSDFDTYLLMVSDLVPETDGSTMYFQVSEDAGTTWEDDAGDYRWANHRVGDGGAEAIGNSAADTKIELDAGVGNASGESGSYCIYFTTPSGSRFKKTFWTAIYNTAAGLVITLRGAGQYDGSTNAINGVRVTPSADGITAGTFALYGVRM